MSSDFKDIKNIFNNENLAENTNLNGCEEVNLECTEKLLLEKIDIKYFRNNPDYITKWQQYFYNHDCDVKILFLMKYKKISADYHWLYLELSKFFALKGKTDISVFILEDAINNGVYDDCILKKELELYCEISPAKYKEAYRYLNPTGFLALGKIWNEIRIEYFYDTKIYSKGFSFEEFRMQFYKMKKIGSLNTQLELYKRKKEEHSKHDVVKRFKNNQKCFSSVQYSLSYINLMHCFQKKYFKKMLCDFDATLELKNLNFYEKVLKCSTSYNKAIKCDTENLLQNTENTSFNLISRRKDEFLISFEDCFEKAPDIIKLKLIYEVFTFSICNKILIIDLKDIYFTSDFLIASYNLNAQPFDRNFAFLLLFKSFKCFIDEFLMINFNYEVFLNDIEELLLLHDIQHKFLKFKLYIYEITLSNCLNSDFPALKFIY